MELCVLKCIKVFYSVIKIVNFYVYWQLHIESGFQGQDEYPC